jgi:hypothetical protein
LNGAGQLAPFDKKRIKDLKDERKKNGGTEDPHQAQGL